jgi:hypothetical protein
MSASFRVALFFWLACLTHSLLAPIALANSKPRTQMSNLSDGTFERQLEVPPTVPLVPNTPEMHEAVRFFQAMPFNLGERIRYSISYLGVEGGTAEVMLRTPVKWKTSWALRITAEVMSSSWYKWIAQIHDSLEGLASPTSEFEPLHFYLNQQEGDFRQSKILAFEPDKVFQKTQRKNRDLKSETFDLKPNTKDAMGALYYFRTQLAQKPDQKSFEFPLFTSEKNWILKAKWEESETRKLGGVKVETDVWQVQSFFGGLMEQKGDIRMWVTRDARRLPIYVEANIKFGSIKLHLHEWDPGFQLSPQKQKFEKFRRSP